MLQTARRHVLTNSSRLSTASKPYISTLLRPSRQTNQWRASTSVAPRHVESNEKPFYVTTPIFYVNAAPHVGHLYSMVLADIFKRWQELKGRKAILCTGTDEHGMKIQRAADKAKTEPKAFCDKGAQTFKDLLAEAGVSNDHFIRTTDPDHREAVQYAWTLLEERGYIYLDKHEGWYSVSDETFYPPSAVQLTIDPPTGRKIMTSVETSKEVEWTSETNYRFRLSTFKNQLLSFYKRNSEFIKPHFRMQQVIQEVETGLEDLSVSRPSQRLKWGIPVPKDDAQTIYVWLDALLNYATKAGYPWAPGSENAGGWPADLQVIGKDIIRFHCIYWPAFLMALNLPTPTRILTHAHWTLGREKMSKSTGNVANPFFAINRFTTDVMRYYLAHDGGIANDADYSNEFIIDRYKKDLQGGMGNLASRLTRGKGWDVRESIKAAIGNQRLGGDDNQIFVQHGSLLSQTATRFAEKMDDADVRGAIPVVMHLIYSTNNFMQSTEPWTYAKAIHDFRGGSSGITKRPSSLKGVGTGPKTQNYVTANLQSEDDVQQAREKMQRIVFHGVECLRISGILLLPVMPTKMTQLLDMLGVKKEDRNFAMARYCADKEYGDSFVSLGKGHVGTLFPPLLSEF